MNDSAIARKVAIEMEWGDIHTQAKVGPGIFNFSCSGHGGIVVVARTAKRRDEPVSAEVLAALEARTAKVWLGRFSAGGRRVYKAITSLRYGQPIAFDEEVLVYVLEEDVDWSLAVLALQANWTNPKAFRFTSDAEAVQHAQGTYDRWLAKS